MAHYRAGQSPAPSTVGNLSRRAMLRGSALAAGAVTLPGLLAACGSKEKGSSGNSNDTSLPPVPPLLDPPDSLPLPHAASS